VIFGDLEDWKCDAVEATDIGAGTTSITNMQLICHYVWAMPPEEHVGATSMLPLHPSQKCITGSENSSLPRYDAALFKTDDQTSTHQVCGMPAPLYIKAPLCDSSRAHARENLQFHRHQSSLALVTCRQPADVRRTRPTYTMIQPQQALWRRNQAARLDLWVHVCHAPTMFQCFITTLARHVFRRSRGLEM
jgi:hypothetical protein